MRKNLLMRIWNFWPPFLGAGIRITRVAPDLSWCEVEMKLRAWNRNYVGTHFGGSLYAMTDPFLMVILIEALGRDYLVWDKSASIRFKKPGRGRVRARFEIAKEKIEEIRARANAEDKVEPEFVVQVLDESNEVVAEVHKLLHVRRKDKARRPG